MQITMLATIRPSTDFATGAGLAAASALVMIAALHIYWVAGGKWGVTQALGDRELPLDTFPWRAGTALVAAALLAAAVIVLGSLDLWSDEPGRLFDWGVWVVSAALLLGGVINLFGTTQLERLGFAPLAFTLGVLVAIVALWRVGT